MANATAHRLGAGLTVGLTSLTYELNRGEQANLARPLAASSIAALAGTLPDILEPATSPRHRQVLHSIAFAGGLGYGMYKLYRWEPEDDWGKLLQFVGLAVGGAYLVHLAMDVCTPASLPLVGKLG